MAETKKTTANNPTGPNNTVVMVLVGLLIVSAFALGMMWTKLQSQPSGTGGTATNPQGVAQNPEELQKKIEAEAELKDSDWVRGSEDAKIAIIEYSDLSCPFCQQYHPRLSQVVADNNDVMWVYRHFPLTSIHPNAQAQAEAAECAGKIAGSDAFWGFVDGVFDEGANTKSAYVELAGTLGVNTDEFTQCVEDRETRAKVEEDTASALATGARGTPSTLLVNLETGEVKTLQAAVQVSDLQAAIDELRGSE